MADVLGKYSFLDTPDVNGDLVLLTTNPVMAGTGSVTIPVGTTAQRPGSPTSGMLRFNSTTGRTEYYNGSTWIPSSNILQTVTGNVAATSSNAQIPFDNTVPLSTEGVQLWSQSFTPILATSLIMVISSGFYAVASAADVYVTHATFNATTCFAASFAGFTTSSGEGRSFSNISTQTAGSTAARTYSARMGPASAVTVYYNQGTGGQNYGGTVNLGSYIIQEIAQ